MGTYAKDTAVNVQNSQMEIERTLTRYGATGFMRGWDESRAVLAFMVHGKQIRFVLPMPNKEDFARTDVKRIKRSEKAQHEAWEQACRQKWRALALVVKAKLEAIDSQISTFEDEFLAWIVLPSGETVGHAIKPKIEEAYLTGKVSPLLLASGE